MNKTKFLLVIFLLISCFAAAKNKQLQDVFKKYDTNDELTAISANKTALSIATVFADKKDKKIVSKIDGIKILKLEENSTLSKALINDLTKAISSGKLELLLETHEKGNQVITYYFREESNGDSDLLIITKENNEMSVTWITGQLTKKDLQEYKEQSEKKKKRS